MFQVTTKSIGQLKKNNYEKKLVANYHTTTLSYVFHNTLTYSAHFLCHHPGYAHTFEALVTINVLTAQTHITYPEGYCYIITITTVSGVSSIDINIVERKYMPVSGVSLIENYPLTEGAYIL
jgi:hypothetical protein